MRQLKITRQITNRETESLERYLSEIGKISMVSPEEEVLLAQKIKQGDQKALDKLVQANLRFVVSVAKQYQHQGLTLSDLINEGNLGVIKAAQRFNETKGFKFISYAVWWIRQSILQGLAEHSRIVQLPQNKIGLINKTHKALGRFEQEYEREPSPEELAEFADLPESVIKLGLSAERRHTSLDAPLHEGEDPTLGDILPGDIPDSDSRHESLQIELRRVLTRCIKNPRDIEIIYASFGIEGRDVRSLEDIGKDHDLTRERIRQIKDRTIKRLQKMSAAKHLIPFLG